MWSNAGEMLGRAAGKPIRVARESVRRRPLLRAILNRRGGAVAAAGQAPIYRGEGRCFA